MSYQNTDAQFIRGIRVSIIPPLSGETLIYNLSTKQYEPGAGTGGGLTYEGLWNATTNDPSISDGTGTAGHYYVVEVAGTQDLGSGDIDFTVGDWAIYSNTGVWQRIDASDQVKTVFGRAGEVIAVAGDYTGSQITNVPSDSIESTNTQDAIDEVVDLNNNRTNGVVTLPTITDNGDGTVDIAADGSFNSYLTPTLGGTIKRWTVATPAVALVPTDGGISYLYADYNAGTPLYGITTDGTGFFTNGDRVAIARVVRDDTEICIIDYDEFGVALPNKSYYKDIALNGFGRQSGLSLSTVATRIPTVEAGSAWLGVTLQSLPENEAGVSGTLYEWYLTAGVWSKSVVTEYDSDYYSDGTDRQTLTSNRYVAKYFYRNVSSNNCVSYISGEQYTTAASALGESIPTAPVTLTASSIYVGKIVIQEGDTNGTAYSRAWDGALDVASTSDHTGLANLNWTSSGHIGTADKIAGFNGTGVASEYGLSGADGTLITGTAGTSGNYASWNADGDIVDGGAIPVASFSPYDATVGTGGDYATVDAALTAGNTNIYMVGDTTEIADFTVPSGGFDLVIGSGTNWNMATYQMTWTAIGSPVVVKGEGARGGTITYSGLTYAFDQNTGAYALEECQVSNVQVDFSGGGAGTRLIYGCQEVDRVTFTLPDAIGTGLRSNDTPASWTNLEFIGGGTTCKECLYFFGLDQVVDNIRLTGTFNSTANNYVIAKTGSQNASINNLVCGTALNISPPTGTISNVSAEGTVSVDIDITVGLSMSNCVLYEGSISIDTNSGVRITNTKCNNIEINGRQLVQISNCRIDDGTITLDSGSANNTITGNIVDLPIVDNSGSATNGFSNNITF